MMNIHEYQAKGVLQQFGIPVPQGKPAFSVDEAVRAADRRVRGYRWRYRTALHRR